MLLLIILAASFSIGAVKTQDVTTPAPSFCIYKRQFYRQGETWKDGCHQTCTCLDASKGIYSCSALCLTWPTLPQVCHLEDPPTGLCCHQPRCPSHIHLTVPYEYKDEYPGYTYVGDPLVG